MPFFDCHLWFPYPRPFGFFPKNLGGVCVCGRGCRKEEGSVPASIPESPFLGMGLRVWKAGVQGEDRRAQVTHLLNPRHFGVHPSTDSRTSGWRKSRAASHAQVLNLVDLKQMGHLS